MDCRFPIAQPTGFVSIYYADGLLQVEKIGRTPRITLNMPKPLSNLLTAQ